MLHEVLFALLGHSGGIFVDDGDEIRVLSDVPFISPSEIDILNTLCRLGTHYRTFNNFIKKHGETLICCLKKEGGGRIEGIHGLYLKSFCNGLDKLLADYRQAIEALEAEALSDPHLPVSHIVGCLQEYQLLFPALLSVIEQITNHKAHGCYILDILHKNSVCGLPAVKSAMYRILHACHSVLFKQLCSWLLYGSLRDPYNEFFVQLSSGDDVDLTTASQEDEDELGLLGVTGRQLQKALSLTVPIESKGHKFSLRADLLPVYIPVRVANHILFVGESIQMFENDRKPNAYKKGSILKNKEEEFARELYDMSAEPDFNPMLFETLIDKIRTHVAEQLWVLVVQDSDLLGHLKIIKDFYLLGRGELFLAFIDQTQSLLRTPPVGTTEHDINTAFQQSARNVLIDDEGLLQRFHLTITAKSLEKRLDSQSSLQQSGPVECGWTCIGLSYMVQWPLHIFFTTSVLDKYNRVFRFLLAVRRTQLDLQQSWTLQMQHKQGSPNPVEAAKWQLRMHMCFLVDNLQYYLQVDVIESQYGILVDKINSTRDFEAVKLAHDQYLAALLSQSFTHTKSVSQCLHEILEQCSAFSHLLSCCESPMSHREIAQLQTIGKNFQQQSNLLFKILSSVRSHNASPHLDQLLLRLDYNKYFTTAGGQLGRFAQHECMTRCQYWYSHYVLMSQKLKVLLDKWLKNSRLNVQAPSTSIFPDPKQWRMMMKQKFSGR